MTPDSTILVGDAREKLATLPESSVHCAITSPPYWGLRDYGVTGQIGLESTPDEYIETLVEVFRAVRRVLRSDGTLWINLGDSYTSGDRGTCRSGASSNKGHQVQDDQPRPRTPPGLKPKDLCGIPWSVARALQRPYYTGNIKNERDRVWLVATLEAEGTICGATHTRKDDGSTRTAVHVAITNTSTALLDECFRIWPTSRKEHNPHGPGHRGSLPIWRWIAHGAENKALLMRELYPYSVSKRKQILLAWNFFEISATAKCGARKTQPSDILDRRLWLMRALSKLNKHTPVDIPSWCKEPPDCHEPGWYLRSAMPWVKRSPMPESCTDRPTSALEYVFLLTKQPRYYFDMEAVRVRTGNEASPEEYAQHLGSDILQVKHLQCGMSSPKRDGFKSLTNPAGRAFRNTDLYYASLKEPHGLICVGDELVGLDVVSEAFKDAHFATFPRRLVEPMIRAGTSERGCCPECGAPWVRVVERTSSGKSYATGKSETKRRDGLATAFSGYDDGSSSPTFRTVGWKPGCECQPSDGEHGKRALVPYATGSDVGTWVWKPIPCTVLDPFDGAGTTRLVAKQLGRRGIGIELNPEYARMAEKRIANPEPLPEIVDVDGQEKFSFQET